MELILKLIDFAGISLHKLFALKLYVGFLCKRNSLVHSGSIWLNVLKIPIFKICKILFDRGC